MQQLGLIIGLLGGLNEGAYKALSTVLAHCRPSYVFPGSIIESKIKGRLITPPM